MSYEFNNGKVLDLEVEIVSAGRRARGGGVPSTSVSLPAIPCVFRNRV